MMDEAVTAGVPLRLLPATAWRTYRGGSLMARRHGAAGAEDTNFPEAWLLSAVTARNPGREHLSEGLSVLAGSNKPLRGHFKAAPEALLGPGRRDLAVLVKLIDAAERLSVQVHPTRADAKRLFDSDFGKTECWHILDTRRMDGEAPCIYLGFREGVTKAQWRARFLAQDIPGLLHCLHRMEVRPGETYLIPGGTPHAIGAGCFLAEIQEPTDLTLRVERVNARGEALPEALCHQGVGFDNMLDCFRYEGCSLEEARRRWRILPRVLEEEPGAYARARLVGYEQTPYFQMERLSLQGSLDTPAQEAFCGLYVAEGEGALQCGGVTEALRPGDTFFVPANVRPYRLTRTRGTLTVLRYEGPKA